MKLKYYQKSLFPILIAVFAVRCAELLLLIEPGSAYYKTGDVYHYFFNIFYIAAAVFFFSAYFFFSRKACGADFLSRKTSGKKAAFMLAGIFFAAAAAEQTVSLFSDSTLLSADIFKNFKFYIAVLYIIASVSLIIISFCKAKATLQSTAFRIIVLSLPILYVFRLFDIYVESEGLISKTFGAFEVLEIAFTALCLMAFARAFISDCRRKNFSVFLWIASIFASVRFADTVISMLRNEIDLMSVNIIQKLADILLIIALLLINNDFYRRKRRKSTDITSEEIPAVTGEGENVQ